MVDIDDTKVSASEVMKALHEFKTELGSTRDDVKSFMLETRNQYSALSQKMDEFNNRCSRLESKVDQMGVDQELVQDEVDDLRKELNVLQQRQLDLNLIIKGMPEVKSETTEQTRILVTKLFRVMGVPDATVDTAKRVGKKSGLVPRIILFTVINKQHKTELLAVKRKKTITAADIFPTGSAKQFIYIDQHLTKHNDQLFKRARDIGKERNTKYVWVKDGTIYMKQDDAARAIPIRSDNDLDNYGMPAGGTPGQKRKGDTSTNNHQRAPKQPKSGMTTRSMWAGNTIDTGETSSMIKTNGTDKTNGAPVYMDMINL